MISGHFGKNERLYFPSLLQWNRKESEKRNTSVGKSKHKQVVLVRLSVDWLFNNEALSNECPKNTEH